MAGCSRLAGTTWRCALGVPTGCRRFSQSCSRALPGVRVAVKGLDVTDHLSVFKVFGGFAEELGGLDRVVVNAGMGKGASIGTGYFRANKQTAEFPGYIASEMTARAGKTPFMVDTETGCRAMVDAIERETAEATVPAWPWKAIGFASSVLPLRVVRKLM